MSLVLIDFAFLSATCHFERFIYTITVVITAIVIRYVGIRCYVVCGGEVVCSSEVVCSGLVVR